jgi:hypothetical protein
MVRSGRFVTSLRSGAGKRSSGGFLLSGEESIPGSARYGPLGGARPVHRQRSRARPHRTGAPATGATARSSHGPDADLTDRIRCARLRGLCHRFSSSCRTRPPNLGRITPSEISPSSGAPGQSADAGDQEHGDLRVAEGSPARYADASDACIQSTSLRAAILHFSREPTSSIVLKLGPGPDAPAQGPSRHAAGSARRARRPCPTHHRPTPASTAASSREPAASLADIVWLWLWLGLEKGRSPSEQNATA